MPNKELLSPKDINYLQSLTSAPEKQPSDITVSLQILPTTLEFLSRIDLLTSGAQQTDHEISRGWALPSYDRVPAQLRFNVLNLIGAGTKSTVFLAYDLQQSQRVALRTTPVNLALEEPHTAESMTRDEAEHLRKQNPIAPRYYGGPYEIQVEGELVYATAVEYMDPLEYRGLDKILEIPYSHDTPKKILDVASSVANALAILASDDIFPKDLRLSNMMARYTLDGMVVTDSIRWIDLNFAGSSNDTLNIATTPHLSPPERQFPSIFRSTSPTLTSEIEDRRQRHDLENTWFTARLIHLLLTNQHKQTKTFNPLTLINEFQRLPEEIISTQPFNHPRADQLLSYALIGDPIARQEALGQPISGLSQAQSLVESLKTALSEDPHEASQYSNLILVNVQS